MTYMKVIDNILFSIEVESEEPRAMDAMEPRTAG